MVDAFIFYITVWMGKAMRIILLCLLTLVVSAGFGFAQPYSIQIIGNQRIETSTVFSYLDVDPEKTLPNLDSAELIKKLYATGFFSDIHTEIKENSLIVHVKEYPIIKDIYFEGNQALKEADLKKGLALSASAVFSPQKLFEFVQKIQITYQQMGYFSAIIVPKSVALPDGRVDIIFDIQEGSISRISQILFFKNSAFSQEQLQEAIASREFRWWRLLSGKTSYSADRFALDQRQLLAYYKNNGYADIQILSASAEFIPQSEQFLLSFVVEEGALYRFGAITLENNLSSFFDYGLFEEALDLKKGQVYNAQKIQAQIEKFKSILSNKGFAFPQISVKTQANPLSDVASMDVVFIIDKSPRIFLERIDILGNNRTLDSVIRQEIDLQEGDLFNASVLARSRQKIENLGYFERVDLRSKLGSSADQALVEFEVIEQHTAGINLDLGYSTLNGTFGAFGFQESNFLGKGQNLLAKAAYASKKKGLTFSWGDSSFLDHPFGLNWLLFADQSNYNKSQLNQIQAGLNFGVGLPMGDYWIQRLNYFLNYTKTTLEDGVNINQISPYIQKEKGEVYKSGILYTIEYDKRDQTFLTKNGYSIELKNELSGLGGDVHYLKHILDARFYYPIVDEKVVFSLLGQGGYIYGWDAFGRAPWRDRFFLGGESLRGFAYYGVGPKDSLTKEILGGHWMYRGSAQLRFPLGFPSEYKFYGIAFTDFGSVGDPRMEDGSNIVDTSALRMSAGLGFEWYGSPWPIKMSFAFPILKEQEDDIKIDLFSIGYSF